MSAAVERPLDRRIVGDGQHRRVEGAPQEPRASRRDRAAMWMTAVPRVIASCDHFAGAAAAARRKAVPHRDQYVAMRDRRRGPVIT